jgi:translation initiation factor 1 (eIF-1/SUI1)
MSVLLADLAVADRCLIDLSASVRRRSPVRDRRRGKGMAVLEKGVRVTGAERGKLASKLEKQYAKGNSIRRLAEEQARSYGFVRRVLCEAGVTLQGRGGANRATLKVRGDAK